MTAIQIIVVLCYAAAIAAIVYAVVRRTRIGSPVIAWVLFAAFTVFSLIAVARDGIVMFWTNHTANLVGVQVWWDLLLATIIAFIFIAPRARAVGMNVPLWAVLVATTASIGLLPMAARLFTLERARQTDQAE